MGCTDCKRYWKLRKKEPDCEECMPYIMPGNQEALFVYDLCKGQFTSSGMGGPVDIDFNAIALIMDMYGVEERQLVFERVRMAWHHIRALDETKPKGNK